MSTKETPETTGVEELQIQAALRDDIQHLNSQLLLHACHRKSGDRLLTLLRARKSIRTRIAAAGSRGLGTAIRCGVPLVTMTAAVEPLLTRDVHAWPRDKPGSVPADLKALTLESLQFARMSALHDLTVAQLYFGLTRSAAKRFARISSVQVTLMSERRIPLLRLRAHDNTVAWDRLLMGDHCAEPMASRISQMTGMQLLGAEQ